MTPRRETPHGDSRADRHPTHPEGDMTHGPSAAGRNGGEEA